MYIHVFELCIYISFFRRDMYKKKVTMYKMKYVQMKHVYTYAIYVYTYAIYVQKSGNFGILHKNTNVHNVQNAILYICIYKKKYVCA